MESNPHRANGIKAAAAMYFIALLFWATLSLECSFTRYSRHMGPSNRRHLDTRLSDTAARRR